jgi:hypothetical protein
MFIQINIIYILLNLNNKHNEINDLLKSRFVTFYQA